MFKTICPASAYTRVRFKRCNEPVEADFKEKYGVKQKGRADLYSVFPIFSRDDVIEVLLSMDLRDPCG